MFNKYYQDEVAYLREMGREFSALYPEAAHFVGESSKDPDVERLLEGFAFLTARLRQKLEDEIPELTHSLLEMFFPHYLRPVPSFTILQFEALAAAAKESKLVARGAAADSAPVDGTACRFRTIYETAVQPLTFDGLTLRADAPPNLKLRFKMTPGVGVKKAGLKSLRLHLTGDAAASRSLFLCLARYVKRISAQAAGGSPVVLDRASVKPVGFAPEDALLPFSGSSFPGFRLLLEYFCFPTKFMFLDITGLDALAQLGEAAAFELTFDLERVPENMPPVSASNVLLHCAPAVNLFAQDADPVRLDQERVEYKVRPTGLSSDHYEIYTIDKVTGQVMESAKSQPYLPLFRFGRTPTEKGQYYRHRLEPSLSGEGHEVFLSPLLPAALTDVPEVETLSIELTCTNRQLPAKLKIGDVSLPTTTSPNFAKFRNVTKPTTSVAAPTGGDLHYRLLSHMALNYLSLIDLNSLRAIFGLYHFRARVDRQADQALKLLLEGLKKISSAPSTRFLQGTPVRGIQVELELDEDAFGGEGEAYLFGTILNEFFAQYVTMNAFCRLTVKGLKYGEIHTWPTRIGQRIIL